MLNSQRTGMMEIVVCLLTGLAALVGGWDVPLKWLAIFMVIDFMVGTATSLIVRRECWNNLTFWKGILIRLLAYPAAIILAVGMQEVLHAMCQLQFHGELRSAVIAMLIGKEAVSLARHLRAWGIDVPAPLRQAISQIQEKHSAGSTSPEEKPCR